MRAHFHHLGDGAGRERKIGAHRDAHFDLLLIAHGGGEARGRHGDGVDAGIEADRVVLALRIGHEFALDLRFGVLDGDLRVGNHGAAGIGDGAGDAALRGLRVGWRGADAERAERREDQAHREKDVCCCAFHGAPLITVVANQSSEKIGSDSFREHATI